MDSMFERLLTLPLFCGVTQDRMAEVVGKTKFHFLKYQPGETFITPAERCTHLKFILSGSARISIANSRFRVSETLTGPDVVCPDFLFGMANTYPCCAVAIDTVNVLEVEKSDYLNILTTDPVFMFNYLNYLSTNAQKTIDGVMSIVKGNIEERLALWVLSLTQANATDIVFSAIGSDLCRVFGAQRRTFNNAMEKLASRGLITYSDTEIQVADRYLITDLLKAPKYV